jgi:hypothetical protein
MRFCVDVVTFFALCKKVVATATVCRATVEIEERERERKRLGCYQSLVLFCCREKTRTGKLGLRIASESKQKWLRIAFRNICVFFCFRQGSG